MNRTLVEWMTWTGQGEIKRKFAINAIKEAWREERENVNKRGSLGQHGQIVSPRSEFITDH